MSDDRLKLDAISYLYGELDGSASRRLKKAAEDSSELAADLVSLQTTRALYAQDVLPEPSPALTEAIIRQEVMLRAPHETLWSQLWTLLMHPAVGVTALVVVLSSAGLLYRLSTPPPAQTPATMAVTGMAQGDGDTAAARDPEIAEKRPRAEAQPVVAAGPEAAAQTIAKATAKKRMKQVLGDDVNQEMRADLGARSAASRKRARLKPAPAPKAATLEPTPQKLKAPSGWAATRGQALNHELGRAEDKNQIAKDRSAVARAKQEQSDGLSSTASAEIKYERWAERPQKSETSSKRARRSGFSARDSLSFGPSPQEAPPQPADSIAMRQRSAAVGSAGQLTAPSQLAAPSAAQNGKGSAGNIASVMDTSSDGRAENEEVDLDEVAVAANKPARRIQIKTRPNRAGAKELKKMDRARGKQRVQQNLDSAMVAFDRRHYEDAIDLFRRVQGADRDHKMFGPLPRIMEARSLKRLRRYRQAAAIYETVLRDFSKLPDRRRVSQELLACYQASGQTELAQRTKRSMQVLDEADTEDAEAVEATPAAEPAGVPARR